MSTSAVISCRNFIARSRSSISPKPQHFRSSSATSTFTFRTRNFSSLKDDYEYVLVDKRFSDTSENSRGAVGLIKLNRPKALNALCDALFEDLIHAARAMNADDEIGCLVITGNHKAFAAGADIAEMKNR